MSETSSTEATPISPIAASAGGAQRQAAKPAAVLQPVEVIALLIDSPSVKLSGFEKQVMPNSWLRPSLPMIPVTGAGNDGAIEIAQHRRRAAGMSFAAAALFSVAALAMGYLAGQHVVRADEHQVSSTLAKQTAGAWTTEQITAEGVRMRVLDTNVLFRIGESLPSGELLLTTDPGTGTYRTNKSAVALRSEAGARAASAASAAEGNGDKNAPAGQMTPTPAAKPAPLPSPVLTNPTQPQS